MMNKRKETIFFYLGTSHSVSLKNSVNALWNQFHSHSFTWIGCTVRLPEGKEISSFSRALVTYHNLTLDFNHNPKPTDWIADPVKIAITFPFSLCLCVSGSFSPFSPSLRVSWNAGRRARRACLCVGGLSASFLFKQEPTQRPHFPAKFKPEAMLTVWCYRPLCNRTSVGKVAWTWVGNSTPHSLLHHSELTATFRLMFFIQSSIRIWWCDWIRSH